MVCSSVSYGTIRGIPNDVLLHLFNFCVENRTAPQNWFVTILVGILKLGKDGAVPDNYRLVGLECCLLKCLTLLIDIRIRAWAETNNILPDSQNGFRENYRTHNNSYILRCAIDRARAQGQSLYVAFVDLKNAFPATDLPTLWMKLYAAGVAGPLFDWLRMLYARMAYVVRQGSDVTDAFKSLIGVLTGDTASPILWNIYFADLANAFDADPDDLLLDGVAVSHLEQADDVVLFSTTAAGLQRKLNAFFGWCSANFMVISISKTEWMIFGEIPIHLPIICVGDTPINLTSSYKYVGLTFTSVERNIFALHYSVKASKARAVANTSFAVKANIGCLPPVEGIRLYMSRVDPHLTFGCEVSLDTTIAERDMLADVQHQFLRRLLGLHQRSILAVLFSETGVMPIRYRRVLLAVSYLDYVLSLPPNHLAGAALRDSLSLARSGAPSWVSDLRNVLQNLPVPVLLTQLHATPAGITSLRVDVNASCGQWIDDSVAAMCERLPLVQGRLYKNSDGIFAPCPMKLRTYLQVPVPAHRKALTRLLLASHTLGVEVLRYQERHRPPVPRYARMCRMCHLSIETEAHALVGCSHPELSAVRAALLADLSHSHPDMPRQWPSPEHFIRYLAQSTNMDTLQRLAKHTYDVLALFDTLPVFRPAAYSYTTLA